MSKHADFGRLGCEGLSLLKERIMNLKRLAFVLTLVFGGLAFAATGAADARPMHHGHHHSYHHRHRVKVCRTHYVVRTYWRHHHRHVHRVPVRRCHYVWR
jgi:hypothetical protein